jgi:cell division protein FtsW
MKKTKSIDKALLFSVLVLILFGLVMIASAGIAYSKTRFDDPYFFFKHQLFYGIIPGIFALFITQRINYHFWRTISMPFFITSIVVLFLVFVPGVGSRIYGASRWIQLGALSFQPSEMLKLSIIIYLAAWLENRIEKVKDFFEGLIPFLIILGIVSFLLVKQPDMGTLGVIIIIAISIFFISGAKFSHIALMGTLGISALLVLVKTEAYRMNRLLVFLHPEMDPRGIGYQINQALLAVGSGGLLGVGLGHSLQKFNYLPEPVGDSIFAIIGEELGFVGAISLVAVYVFFAVRGLRISKKAKDRFGKLVACGIVVWIISQAFINIAAILALIPLTGVPLPFISYGGTSIVFLLAGVGILLNISKSSEVQ